MLECYLHSHAKNLSEARAPIDHYAYKADYRDLPWGGKEGGWSTGAGCYGGWNGEGVGMGGIGFK